VALAVAAWQWQCHYGTGSVIMAVAVWHRWHWQWHYGTGSGGWGTREQQSTWGAKPLPPSHCHTARQLAVATGSWQWQLAVAVAVAPGETDKRTNLKETQNEKNKQKTFFFFFFFLKKTADVGISKIRFTSAFLHAKVLNTKIKMIPLDPRDDGESKYVKISIIGALLTNIRQILQKHPQIQISRTFFFFFFFFFFFCGFFFF
jgi:hypothetical protein